MILNSNKLSSCLELKYEHLSFYDAEMRDKSSHPKSDCKKIMTSEKPHKRREILQFPQ